MNRREKEVEDVIKLEARELENLVAQNIEQQPIDKVTDAGKKVSKSAKKSKYIGFVFAIVSALLSSTSPIFVKKALLFTAVEQSVIRYTVQFLLIGLIIARKRVNPFGLAKNRWLLVLRGFLGMATLTAWYISLKFINPIDAIAIVYTNVIIVFLFARFTLGEHFSIVHMMALLLAVSGVFFIAQPTFLFGPNLNSLKHDPTSNCSSLNLTCTNQTLPSDLHNHLNNSSQSSSNNYPTSSIHTDTVRLLLGALAALSAAFFSALLTISMKKLCNLNVHFAVSTIYASYVGVPFNLALCLVSYLTKIETRNEEYYKDGLTIMWQVIFVTTAAVCSFFAVVSFNIALKFEDASKVMIVKTSEIFLTFLMQTIFLDVVSNRFSIIGSMLIFSATISVYMYKLIEGKYNNNKNGENEKPTWKKILFYKI